MPAPATDIGVVYIVDDDAALREALAGLFATVGLDSRTYGTAREFFSAALLVRPGCVVTDIRLPDMNGLDFQARLAESGVSLPVVVMSGYGDIPMSVRAMKHGAVDFLAKPFNDQAMLDAVMVAIERDRRRG
jgi:FixJ family two-component response regulator